METIRIILEHVLCVLIIGFLIIFLLTTIITDTKQLRAWAKGERVKEQRPKSSAEETL